MTSSARALAFLLLGLSACASPCATDGVFAYLSDGTPIELDDFMDDYLTVDGEHLSVCPGDWTLPVPIAAEGMLEVVGAGMDETTLVAPDEPDSSALFAYGLGGVLVSDLALRGGGGPAGGAFASEISDVTLERVRVTEGSADVGGGVFVGAGSTLTLIDCEVTGNEALYAGGGAALGYEGTTLTSVDTDWGHGDDNWPEDIALLDESGLVFELYTIEGFASFVCDWDAGSCE